MDIFVPLKQVYQDQQNTVVSFQKRTIAYCCCWLAVVVVPIILTHLDEKWNVYNDVGYLESMMDQFCQSSLDQAVPLSFRAQWKGTCGGEYKPCHDQ